MSEKDSNTPERNYDITKDSDRVPVPQKIAYGMGTTNDLWGNWLYPGLSYTVFNQFLHVAPWLISLALMLNRLIDAVSDPIFGWMSDNTRTRFGRRRPYILVGSILAGLCLPCLFLVGTEWSEYAYFSFMVVSSGVYITVVSSFNMPYQSLGAELTPDTHERTSVFSYKSAIQKIPEIALFAAGAFATSTIWMNATVSDVPNRLSTMIKLTVNWFGEFFASLFSFDFGHVAELFQMPFGWPPSDPENVPNVLLGAQVYTIILGCIMMIVGLIVFMVVRERYYSKLIATHKEDKKIKISETVYECLKCRPFRAQLAMSLAYGIGTSMVGTLGYYATVYYVCGGDISRGAIWNFGMGLSNTIIGAMGVFFYGFISKRIGKRHGMMAVQFSAIAIFVGTWWLYDPSIKWLQLVASGGISFTGAGFWTLYGSIGADVIDYDELESGKRREGAFSACGSWIMKVGMAIGAGCSGIILSATGFDAELGADQLPSAIFWIRFLLAAIPVIGLIIAFFALRRFGLNQDTMYDIRRQLEERRGEV